MPISRRALLGSARATAGAMVPVLPRSAAADAAQSKVVRIPDVLPGNVGAVWRSLITKLGREALGGIELEWVGGNPGQTQNQFLAGAIDITFSGSVGTVELNARGSDLVLFGPGSNNHIRWIVRGDSPYRKPEDLKGKRIATLSETSEQFKQTRIVAALSGFDIKRDLEIVFGPPTVNYALFARGDVEAAVVPEPTASRLLAQGAREIGHVGKLWQEATGSSAPAILVGLAARRSWVEANPHTATRIADLFATVNRKVNERPALLVEAHDVLGIPSTEKATIELLPGRLADAYTTGWDRTVFQVLDRQIDEAIKLGLLAGKSPRPIYLPTQLTPA
jgi:ABC-type nitrate/sulfonate/bicarbonate transport system substrate-binding protein